MNFASRLLAIFSIACCSIAVLAESPEVAHFASGNRQVAYEIYGSGSPGPILILLHGASGPDVPLYRGLAQTFATKNYTVFYLHYFDASDTHGGSAENYAAWQKAVSDLVLACQNEPRWANRKIGLIGFSMGASVALAAGSQLVPVSAVAEWYGSLPDEFFYRLKGMPPLLILHGNDDDNIPLMNAQQLIALCGMKKFVCESHIYPGQGHGFQSPASDDAIKRTFDFFSRQLK
jgi:dienelactone hydrolase